MNNVEQIINASTDGKTTKGYVNDFIHWFSKLENFNPKYVIFYIGINDSNFNQNIKFDIPWREDFFSKIRDYFKNNSKSYELIKKIQFRYFNYDIRKEYGVTKIDENLYKNYKYINYQEALKLHANYNNNKLTNQFYERLNLLKKQINKYDFVPIFITQISYNGLQNADLFIINEALKKFCFENNYYIIKLDELIIEMPVNSFYDTSHTTPQGSKIIADKIYLKLKDIVFTD